MDILIDTNILIYVIDQKTKYIDFMRSLDTKVVGISVITYMEILLGGSQNIKEIKGFVDQYEIIDLNKNISIRAVEILQEKKMKSLRHPKSADILIASTALEYDVSFVTNNSKHFKFIKDLDIIVP